MTPASRLDALDIYDDHAGLRAISPAKVLALVEKLEAESSEFHNIDDLIEIRRLRTALTWIRDARKHPSRTTDMTRNDMRELAGAVLQGEKLE